MMDDVNNKKPICILVMGGPASGKGTYCKKLAEEFGMIHLSIGDILREERKKNTDEGKFLDFHMKAFETTGRLMPSEVVAQFLYLEMYKLGWNKNVYLVDGMIKAKASYDCWNKMFSKIVDTRFVLYLECSREGMLKRLLKRSETSDRLDDNDKIFITRINTFYNCTYPCIELFNADGLVKKINTENKMDIVYKEIRQAFLDYYPEFAYI